MLKKYTIKRNQLNHILIYPDVNIGQILKLIDTNITRNMNFLKTRNVKVMELDFKAEKWPSSLETVIQHVDYVFAADGTINALIQRFLLVNCYFFYLVIYDNDLTEAFVQTVERLLVQYDNINAIYVALEKRFVFLQNDSMPEAPMYEYFVYCMEKLFERHNNASGKAKYQMRPITLNFPQFFEYERVKDLVLIKIFPIKCTERKDA